MKEVYVVDFIHTRRKVLKKVIGTFNGVLILYAFCVKGRK
jgi:hypothetical protein